MLPPMAIAMQSRSAGASGHRGGAAARRAVAQRGAKWAAHEMQNAGVEGFQPRPVPDADDGRAGELVVEDRHHPLLAELVERRGRLVEEYPGRPVQQQSREADQLLLAERQALVEARRD